MINHRKTTSFKTSALALVLLFLFQTFFPSILWALSGSQQQPEYLSYESFGSTDMVNLSTGDFTYNIPLLEVPGPEGSFQMPLAYHGGIGLEEEASWVGLGWSMNPGSINRTTSGFPDDYSGELISTTLQNEGGNRTYIDVNLLFAGYSYDSERGRGGYIMYNGFGLGFGTMEGIYAAGFKFDHDGISGYGLRANSDGLNLNGKEFATSAALRLSGLGSAYGMFNLGSQYLMRSASLGTSTAHINNWTIETRTGWFKTEMKYYLDFNSSRTVFGSLYSAAVNGGATPEIGYDGNQIPYTMTFPGNDNPGKDNKQLTIPPHPKLRYNGTAYNVANVYHQTIATDSYENYDNDYQNIANPNHLTFDQYNVFGNNISGNIEPFRIDMGSLAPHVKNLSQLLYHESTVNFKALDYLPYSYGVKYKPQFRYLGENVNKYDFNKGDINTSDFTFALQTASHNTREVPLFDLTGTKLQPGGNYENSNRSDGTFKNNKVKFGRHIEWVTNWDLMSNDQTFTDVNYFGTNPIYESKIMDHLPEDDGSGGNPRANFRNSFPKLGIGGFAITNTDGVTYHYTIPIFSRDKSSFYGNSSNNSLTEMNGQYAVHWLLTGITGPDFIDRGGINGIANGTIDEEDWGFWVKLDYGKFASNYYWRMPYLSGTYAGNPYNDNLEAIEEGYRESYYLNEIQTRSHRALFIKSLREDGRSSYDRAALNTSSPIDTKNFPSSSLKLDEIVLLTENDYQELTTTHGLAKNNGNNNKISNEDTFAKVWDSKDIDVAQRDEIEIKQLLRHKFNYRDFQDPIDQTFLLCKDSYNSFPSAKTPPRGALKGTGGKLTLKSISQYGKEDKKLMPDYEFKYSSDNPSYDHNKFDGWGMYKATGTTDRKSHLASVDNSSAYCLEEVATPSGQTITVEYERDTYSKITDEEALLNLTLSTSNTISTRSTIYVSNTVDLTDYIQDNQLVKLDDLTVEYIRSWFTTSNVYSHDDFITKKVSGEFLVTNVSSNSFDIAALPAAMDNNEPGECIEYQDQYHSSCATGNNYLKSGTDFFMKVIGIPGGNNRVKSIAMSGGYGIPEIKDRYVYTIGGELSNDAISSGVASYEPEYISNFNESIVSFNELPKTPVMYSDVTVLKGFDELNESFLVGNNFKFQSMNKNMVEVSKSTPIRNSIFYKNWDDYDWQLHKTYNDYNSGSVMNDIIVKDKSSMLGKLLEKSNFNGLKQTISKEKYFYKPLDQGVGVMSNGTILLDLHEYKQNNTFGAVSGEFQYVYRFIRTRKWNVPYSLTAVETTSDGISNRMEYVGLDPLSGAVLETEYVNSKGDRFKSKIVPAYSLQDAGGTAALYDKMGSKFDDPSNKNMLSAPAAEYLYVYNDEDETWDPLTASIQTWANNWNYRVFNSIISQFEATETQVNDAYRKSSTFVWNGDKNGDGTYKNFVDYNWNSGTNPEWLKTGENKLYDHFSHLLETEVIGDKSSSSKLNSSNSFVIAQGVNTKYAEFAFSGAEDEVIDGAFGGETRKGSGSTIIDIDSDPIHIHTGNKALMLNGANQYAFGFKKEFLPGEEKKKLRASVWVHKDDRDLLTFSYSYKDVSPTGTTSIKYGSVPHMDYYLKAGDWYLMVLEVPGDEDPSLSVANTLSIQTWFPSSNPAGMVYVDDFRVHPFDGSMNATVYDENTGEVMASIKPNGLAVKYKYDDAGRLIRTYEEVPDYESFTGGFKLRNKYKYDYARPY